MIALARKYRPKQFADLIAQDHVAAALRGAVAQGRVAHGYLFAGPRGVGKTTAARILAMALNCERRAPGGTGEPCGECDACRRIWTGAASLDVVELDAASNRGVDDARDLRERAMYAASTESGSKVYIVDEAHMLTREAWNALLKILEEPPPRVVFVFATTEPQKITNTAAPILSRLQRFDFRRIGPHAIVARLKQVAAAEQLKVEDDALHLIARSANGGMRGALLLVGVGGQPEGLTEGLLAVVRDYAPQLPPADIVRLLTILSDSEERLSRSANQRLLVEVLLLRWAMLDRTVEIGEVLEALKGDGPTARRPDGQNQPTTTARAAPPIALPGPSGRPADRPPGQKLEPTLDNVRSIWPHVISDARGKTPLLASLLAEAEVVAVDGRIVALRPGHAVHAEGLERQRETIAQALGTYISEAPRVTIAAGGGRGSERITPEGASAERLKSLRAKDPTLSAAVDALDLELLE